MPDPASKAVFLSYASQDAEAALRICGALRHGGVEVWLDQDALVGGDAWDRKIRGQIASCTLFLPVISAATQARREGYFRIEWKIAAQRTHAMADGTPFVLPIVIDSTRDADALVPDEFRAVQWTRLSGGMPTPQFVERVNALLGAPAVAGVADPGPKPASARPATTKSSVRRSWLVPAVISLAAVAVLAVWQPWKTPSTTPAAQPPPDLASAKSDDKSIAVLPFANLSEDKDTNAFFADGIHEDILTNLAVIRELRVISRTSVEQYRGTKKTMHQIGEEVHAAYILEGSVRRAGNTVRVTGQLINARTDEHLWAKSYDRELKDVFAIQTALAQEIAGALQAAISPREKSLLEQRPTENVAAYDLYLKARELLRSPGGSSSSERQATLLQAAVDLDPKFAAAWAHLCFSHGWLYYFDRDHTPARMTKAKSAMDTAVRLAPESPAAMRAVGDYSYYCLGDFARAAAQYEQIVRLWPNYAEAQTLLTAVYARLGKWTDSIAAARRVAELDPGDLQAANFSAVYLENGRRYEEARIAHQRAWNAQPQGLRGRFRVAHVSFWATGSTREVSEVFAALSTSEANSGRGIALRRRWAFITGNLTEYMALDRQDANLSPTDDASGVGVGPIDFFLNNRNLTAAIVLMAQGNTAAARTRLQDAEAWRARLETQPENGTWLSELSWIEALRGEKELALQHARKAVELRPEAVDALSGPIRSATLAFVLAWTGDKDRALAEYARLLRVPYSTLNVHEMRHDPRYHPLQGDPRFEALLNDPKNNAPLF